MRIKKAAGPHFYRQGKRKVYLDPVDNILAVRYETSSKAQIRKVLRSLGELSETQSERLLIVRLTDAMKAATAAEQLQPLLDKDKIESVFPVLCDKDSQLLQVLTDEITVRFKPTVRAKERKQIEKQYGLTVVRKNELVPSQFVFKVASAKGMETLRVANELDAAEEVEFAAPNFVSEHRR
jgi:hypothetical protein